MPQPDETLIACDFVRQHSVLLTHGDLRPLFERWHRHYDEHRLDLDPALANHFETGLAVFVLHLAGQSRNRHMTWTVAPGEPHASFLFAGSTGDGEVTGRVFTENIATFDKGRFYQDNIIAGKGPFRSYAEFPRGADFPEAAAHYYADAEQRPALFFHLGECRFAMAHAHPDYDEGWFATLDADVIAKTLAAGDLARIETRAFSWRCGCEDRTRLLAVLGAAAKGDPGQLFGDALEIEVRCPRCAARHRVTRAQLNLAAPNTPADQP